MSFSQTIDRHRHGRSIDIAYKAQSAKLRHKISCCSSSPMQHVKSQYNIPNCRSKIHPRPKQLVASIHHRANRFPLLPLGSAQSSLGSLLGRRVRVDTMLSPSAVTRSEGNSCWPREGKKRLPPGAKVYIPGGRQAAAAAALLTRLKPAAAAAHYAFVDAREGGRQTLLGILFRYTNACVCFLAPRFDAIVQPGVCLDKISGYSLFFFFVCEGRLRAFRGLFGASASRG